MKRQPCTFRISGIAIALAAAFGPARAAEPVAQLTLEPRAANSLHLGASTAGVGLGYSSIDGKRFGEFNGLNEQGFSTFIDMNIVERDDETGTWTRIFGRDLGLQDRQLRWDHQRQGSWGYTIEYARVPRFFPLTPVTAVSGIGTNSLTVPATPTTGGPVELSTHRDIFGLSGEKYLSGNWDVQLSFRNEKKEGARLFGRGTTGTGPSPSLGLFEFTPEPINATTRQVEAKLNYTGGPLLLTGGYYGTLYNNAFTQLDINGGNAGLASFTPIALPPDNQSHQLYLDGGYAFSSTTRSTFKLAYARQTQENAFASGPNVPLATNISPGDTLNGRVDTKLAQFGLTSRPMPKLTLTGDLRYDDRDDKTPVRVYLDPPVSTSNGENEPRSIQTRAAKLEAAYALAQGFKLIGGLGWEEKKRNVSAVRIVSARETTDDRTYRLELRRTMSETVTGSVSYLRSDRDGSSFLTTTQNNGSVGSNLIAPLSLADRTRDRVRLTVNWQPSDPLALTFSADRAKDDYSGRDGSNLGPRKGEAGNVALDASYTFSDRWQASAWLSRGDTKAEQATCEGASSAGVCLSDASNPTWAATLRNISKNFGAGLRGKPSGKTELGADLSYSNIKDESDQQTIAGGAVPSIPDITTRLTRLNVYLKYALQKNTGVRIDYVYDRFSTDDWTWQTWTFADGTTLVQNPNQKMNFIGVSYYYRWQ